MVNGGGIAAIVIVVLGVTTTVTVLSIILAVFCWKRRQYSAVLGVNTSGPSHRPTVTQSLSATVHKQQDDNKHSNGKVPDQIESRTAEQAGPKKKVPPKPKPLRPPDPVARASKSPVNSPLYEVHSYAQLEPTEADCSVLLEKNVREDLYKGVNHYKNPADNKDALYAQLKACGIKTIKRAAIKTVKHLGSGQFGSVELGEWRSGPNTVEVALKTLYKGASLKNTIAFLQEAAVMAQFKHPNVIKLHGVVSAGDPIILVVELAECDLLEHLDRMRERLQSNKESPAEMSVLLLKMSQQVGLGMQYLSAKGFVHRDLAARNILVQKKICKIADFGMSRNVAVEEVYVSSGGKIPLKWTAPEAIFYKTYTSASDVWSYGCVLYEIWSFGYKPFGNEVNTKVVELVKSGFRLPPPPGCPRALYKAMIQCWNPIPEQRPTFRDVVLGLVGDRDQILSIPSPDMRSHPEARTLGADLEAGLHMYRDLQNSYR